MADYKAPLRDMRFLLNTVFDAPAAWARLPGLSEHIDPETADAILEEAREWDADIIIVGSHGYGRLKRMVLGSVAGAVVANAHCSVLVAREKPHAQHAAA